LYLYFKNISKYIDYIRKYIVIVVLALVCSSCTFLKKIHTDPNSDDSDVVLEWSETTSNENISDSDTGEVAVSANELRNDPEPVNPVIVTIVEPEVDNSSVYESFSTKFGYQLSGTENVDFLKEVDEWLGTPYKYGSRIKQKGTDCSGFVGSVYLNVYGITLSRMSSAMYNDVKPIKKENLQEGDIIFFKINGKTISHVGIYISNNKFAHASVKRGVVINDLDEEYYKKRFFTGGRVE